jgi:hypothetical protein
VGTSGAYTGSGGAWSGAQRKLDDLLAGDDATAADVLAPAAGALDWDDGTSAGGDDGEEGAASAPLPLAGTGVAPIRIRTRGRGGGGGAPAAGGGARAGGRTGRARGVRRSRQRAARLGAGVAAAGYALRARDVAGLRQLGLDLTELAGLSPAQQAQRIIDVVVGTAASIADVEIARATSNMIIALLEAETEPTPTEVVRIFAVEYVFQICLTELGAEMRDGVRDGAASVVTEDEMRELIEARVASLQIEGDAVEADALEAAIDSVLEFTRRVIYERPGE